MQEKRFNISNQRKISVTTFGNTITSSNKKKMKQIS